MPRKIISSLDLTLTDTQTLSNEVITSISPSFVYAVLAGTTTGDTAAIIFRNDNGKLVQIATVPRDDRFSVVSTGYASTDFTLLSLVEEDAVSRAQVRIFSFDPENLGNSTDITLISSFLIDNVYGPAVSTNGARFTSDNRLLVLSYLITGPPNNQGLLSIFDVRSGILVDSAKIGGYSQGAVPFALTNHCNSDGRQFVAIGWSAVDVSPFEFTTKDPAFFEIYRICRGSVRSHLRSHLKLIEQVRIPRLNNSIAVSVKSKIALTFGKSTGAPQENLPDPSPGFFVYKFDGRRLELLFDHPSNVALDGAAFSPSGSFLAVTSRSIAECPGVLAVYRITDEAEIAEEPFFVSPFSISVEWTSEWLVASGGIPEAPTVYPHLFLFRVDEINKTP